MDGGAEHHEGSHLSVSHDSKYQHYGQPHLSVQRDGTRLAFGADTIWPWEVSLTTWLNLAADVLQGNKLPPEGEDKRPSYTWQQWVPRPTRRFCETASTTGQWEHCWIPVIYLVPARADAAHQWLRTLLAQCLLICRRSLFSGKSRHCLWTSVRK